MRDTVLFGASSKATPFMLTSPQGRRVVFARRLPRVTAGPPPPLSRRLPCVSSWHLQHDACRGRWPQRMMQVVQ
eukprot:11194488-Lingulodinium_polyedra.AAC.1